MKKLTKNEKKSFKFFNGEKSYCVILISLTLIVNSCKENTKVRIGFLLPNLTDSRYSKDRDYFISKVTQLGGTVVVGDAQNDPYLQEEQAAHMISNGVNVIIITAVNQNLAASIVRMAHVHDIRIVAYERIINNCDLDYFVAYNHYNVGKQQANYALQNMSGRNYVLLGGDKRDKNAELIKHGQQDFLAPFIKKGKINVIYDIYVEDWLKENAYKEMKRVLVLSQEKIDVVLSASDGLAAGAIEALQEIQPDYPCLVTGMDADFNAIKRIQDGKQTMTVYKSFKQQAEITAQLAMHISKGQKFKESLQTTFNKYTNVPTIYLQSSILDRTNFQSKVNLIENWK